MGKDRNESDQQHQDSLSELSNPNIISTHNSDSDPLNPPKHNPSDYDIHTRKPVRKKQRPRHSSSDSGSESNSEESSRKRGRRKRRVRDNSSESDSEEESGRRGRRKRRVCDNSSESDSEEERGKGGRRKRMVRHNSSESDSEEESGNRGRRKRRVCESSSESGSEEESGKRGRRRLESLSESDSGGERRKRGKRKSRRRNSSSERRKRKKREKEERERKREKEKKKKKRKKEKKERGKKGAVTNSWGKYGIVKETDMWNKRPEFTAWLAEVKQVNLESLSNWEEKKMFKEYMEDYNTATFPSKRYYNLDAYYRRQMEKEQRKGYSKALGTVRTVFNDEEQRRQELLIEREKQKEQEVEALKHSMQSGLAQAMKEQQRLREEMAYQYKIGNFEAAAAIQRRLDPDAAM